MNTNSITLRSFSVADQEQILDILTSNQVNRSYMLPDYKDRNDARPLFHRLMELSENRKHFVRCIDLNGIAIGFLNDVEIKNDIIELGYVIHPEYHNRGYMTEALSSAIKELFKSGYTCVTCGAFDENRASIRVMEKCGMEQMKQTDTIEYRGMNHRCVYYQAVKREETSYEAAAHFQHWC